MNREVRAELDFNICNLARAQIAAEASRRQYRDPQLATRRQIEDAAAKIRLQRENAQQELVNRITLGFDIDNKAHHQQPGMQSRFPGRTACA